MSLPIPPSTTPSTPTASNPLSLRSSSQRRDLWAEAFEKLSPEERQILTKEPRKEPLVIIEDVIGLVEKRSRDYQNAGWKIRRRGSKSDVNVRDGAVKVLKSVISFKDLIASGVAHDPSGYASSVWSVVSLGLQLVKNDLDTLEAVFESAFFLSDLLARFASIDRNFRDRILDDTPDFENTIVNVYWAILVYSAEITKQSRKNIPNRKQESAEVKEAVATIIGRLDQANSALERIETTTLTNEEHQILRWLSNIDYSRLSEQALARREPNSGTWFLDSLEFGDWKASVHTLLWLYGPSGCGKTVLSSIIIENLDDWRELEPHNFLAYWFVTFSDHRTLRIENLVASLIRQLCAAAKSLPRSLRDLWLQHNAAGSRPNTRILIKTLNSILSEFKNVGQNAFIVIDALDEVPNAKFQQYDSASTQDGQPSERRDLLDLIIELNKRHANLHLLITSRGEDDICESFRESKAIKIEDSVAGDLELYVNNAVTKMIEREKWKGKWKAQMKARIIGQDEKRFRWAYLQVQALSDCVDFDQIENALETIPESLEATYAKVLSWIPPRNAEKARFMLLLIAHSFKPLSLADVASAASLPEPDDVLNICTSTFVSAAKASAFRLGAGKDSSDQVVRLDHFSVKEYLVSNSIKESAASYFYKSEQLAHLILGEALVSFLIQYHQLNSHLNLSYSRDPFLKYSIKHWSRHARTGQTCEIQSLTTGASRPKPDNSTLVAERESLEDRTHNLFRFEFSAAYAAWTTSFRIEISGAWYMAGQQPSTWPPMNAPFPPLSCASSLGLNTHVEKLLDDGADIDARSILDGSWLGPSFPYFDDARGILTAVQLAACEGHVDVSSKLLDKGATVTPNDLEFIAAHGQSSLDKILQLILEKRPRLWIDESLVISLLSNRNIGISDALAFLLSTSKNIAIDRTAIVKATKCSDTSEVLAMLLNYCKNPLKLDNAIVTLKIELSPDQVKLLFNCPKIVAGIEERGWMYRMSLRQAAFLGSTDSEYFALMSKYGAGIGAEELKEVVRRQRENLALSKALLDHVGYNAIDETLLLAAAKNWSSICSDLMRYLLNHLERDLVITEQFLEDVANCKEAGTLQLMEYVLQHKPDEVEVTARAVVLAAERSHEVVVERMMRLLLGARGQAPEAVIKAVITRFDFYRPDRLEIVLKVMGPSVLITEEIMELARVSDEKQKTAELASEKSWTAILQDYRSKQAVKVVDRDD
ncbi:MAG: hypothetical protein Q9195_007818 [Heterodermia aff. obscurata]